MNPIKFLGSSVNPWLLIAVAVAWMASLAAVGYWQRHDGAAVERSAWQTRDNEQLRMANAKILALEEGNRKKEQDHAQALQDQSAAYERKLSDEQKQHDRAVAAVRAGAIKLRDPGSATRCPGRSDPGPAGASPGERDGSAGGELSGAASEFLLGETNRANAIVEQLTACQQVVIEDRKLCGGSGEQANQR